jgi:hypothetical protein
MPGGDGTGPAGLGPMTGRAAGYCAGSAAPGFISARGPWSGGWGRRNWFYATGLTGWQRAAYGYPGVPYGMPYGAPFALTPTREQELNVLKGQAEDLEDTLNGIKKRIEELEAKTEK